MNKLPCFLPALTIVILFAQVAGAANTDWKAGSARINITPAQPMRMSGYGGRDKPAEGKLTDLWAKALVLVDGDGNRATLITLDLIGIGRDLSLAICKSLREEFEFKRHQIALCTSHTHTGPVVGRNLAPLHYLLVDKNQQRLIDEYTETLRGKIVAVVGQAIEKLAPSTLSWGSGVATFAVNRRANREPEVPELRTAGQLQGPIDHDVPVLAIRNAEDKLTTVVFGYACHSTVLNFYKWSGDYPGFAQIELEKNHTGCMAMFFAGCGADQNPLPRRTSELARHYGRRLATAVDEVLMTSKMTPVAGKLTTRYREIDLPLGPLPTREEIASELESGGTFHKYYKARARMLLEQIDSGQPLSPTYPYPIGVWQLGDEIQVVFLGGETVVDYAVRLKAELAGEKTWVASYSNDVMAYIPSRRVLREGGYEGGGSMVIYGLPTVWSPKVENAIVKEVHTQLKKR